MKRKTTPAERLAFRDTLDAAIAEFSQKCGDDLKDHLTNQARKLTDDELLEISQNGTKFNRAARCLLVALAAGRIWQQWQCDSTVRDTRRIGRWLRNRF